MKLIHQFGFKHVIHADLENLPVLDCRVIPNPYNPRLTDEAAMQLVRDNKLFEQVVQEGLQLLAANDTIYCGCLFGKHRSGAVAQELAKRTGAKIVKTNII